MTDIMSPQKRSQLMSRIRSHGTKPERIVRSELWKRGFRFAKTGKKLNAGRPDLILPRWNAVVLTHGCFWHGHRDCRYFKAPKGNAKFWRKKVNGNRARDRKMLKMLRSDSWRIAVVWECALRGKSDREIEHVIDHIEHWIRQQTNRAVLELRSR